MALVVSGVGCVTWVCCVSGLAAPKAPVGKSPVAVEVVPAAVPMPVQVPAPVAVEVAVATAG